MHIWEEYSTSRALTKITDDWLREIDKIVGAVLLDFSAAFDIIDHSLMCYGFTPPAILCIKSYLSNRTEGVL